MLQLLFSAAIFIRLSAEYMSKYNVEIFLTKLASISSGINVESSAVETPVIKKQIKKFRIIIYDGFLFFALSNVNIEFVIVAPSFMVQLISSYA